MSTQRIKYAIERTLTVPAHYDGKDIDECIKTFAKDSDFIWCYEHEELFYEER